VKFANAETQTEHTGDIVVSGCSRTHVEDMEPPDQDKSDSEDESAQSEYTPTAVDSDDSEADVEEEPDIITGGDDVSPQKEKKFIVFLSSLMTLLSWCSCPSCGCRELDLPKTVSPNGTLLSLTLSCKGCDKKTVWNSQPFLGRFAAGNILLSASILFAGSSITKVHRVLSHLGVASICSRTFFRHQRDILQPVIRWVWGKKKQSLVAEIKAGGDPMVCGGDGRADSPGHCAKYGTYTLIELQRKVVVELQLVQV
jgi:hypothetical protein